MIQKNRFIVFAFGILCVLFVVLYLVIDTNKTKSKLFFNHIDTINILATLNSELDNFIHKEHQYINFDAINDTTGNFHTRIDLLINESQQSNLSLEYRTKLTHIKKEFLKKELWIERLKSRKASGFNIVTFIFDTSSDEFLALDSNTQKLINTIRVEMIRDIYLGEVDTKSLMERYGVTQKRIQKEPFLTNFVFQLEALEKSVTFQRVNLQSAINPKLTQALLDAKKEITKEKDVTQDIYWLIFNFLFGSIAVFITLIIVFYNKLSKTKKQLSAFKTAVENSDNVIVLTDTNKKIIFANDAFSKITGYSIKDAVGKNPNILKSGLQDAHFYQELNETIARGETWRGRFINKDKNGDIFYENASISPIFEDGVIVGYLAIKLDVTESILHTKELERLNNELEIRVTQEVQKVREMDKILIQQSKMASMGDMMANIAHQWRQPLSAISTLASGMIVQNQLGILSDQEIEASMDKIVKNSEYLSKTIDNFRNFFNPNKPKEEKTIQEVFGEIDAIMKTTLQKKGIEVIENLDHFRLHTHINELKQVLINLIKNASDAIGEDGYIFVEAYIDDAIHIKIKDSGGGIPESIIDKIYEPYFTTKHQSIGTGIGLNMTYQIVTEHLGGTIVASNESYDYEGKEYKGALFHITIKEDHLAI